MQVLYVFGEDFKYAAEKGNVSKRLASHIKLLCSQRVFVLTSNLRLSEIKTLIHVVIIMTFGGILAACGKDTRVVF